MFVVAARIVFTRNDAVVLMVPVTTATIGMVDAYKAMRYGYVDESWAKHHHLRWYEDVAAGRSRQHFADPKAVPPAVAPARTRPA